MRIDPIYIAAAGVVAVGLYLYFNQPKQEPVFQKPLPTNQYVVDPLQLQNIYSKHARPFTYDFNQNEGWNVGNIHRTFRDYLQNKYTLF